MRDKLLKYINVAMLLSIILVPFSTEAYDDENTHPSITINAITKSILHVYIKEKLGFNDGIKTFIPANSSYTPEYWLQNGSKLEDHPNCRAASHFLNPLEDWAVAGVSDTNETILGFFFVNPGCFVMAPFSSRFSIHKYADVTWATGFTAPGTEVTETGNDMDWNAARNYYRLALTASDNATREVNFSKSFQALGQVMHLLQDMAVPAHVRNDFSAHTPFQKIGGKAPSSGFGNTYEWYVKDPNNDASITAAMEKTVSVSPPNLLTALWDANKYTEDSNPSSGLDQGLAEYTNANFFSESTIFAGHKDTEDIHYFKRPAATDTNAAEVENQAEATEVIAEDGALDKRIYVVKNGDNYKMAAYSFVKKWVEYKADENEPVTLVPEYGWAYNLDDEVYKGYAQRLIPRAVGYSAALLDYFFRGQMEITLPPQGIYALSQGLNGDGFSQIRLQARNTTPGVEVMPAGKVTLVARYKVAQADPFQGVEVPVGTEFVYSVATLDTTMAIPRDKPVELSFTFATPIPLWATDLTLQLVYSGRLGVEGTTGFAGEEEAVVLGAINVSEPTPFDYINGMDIFCLNGAVVATGSAEALNAVDSNGYPLYWSRDVFSDKLSNLYLKFSTAAQPVWASPTTFEVKLPELLPGAYARVFYIANPRDLSTKLSHQVAPVPTDVRDGYQHKLSNYIFTVTGLANEEVVENGVSKRVTPAMDDIRGMKVWSSLHWTKRGYPSDTAGCLAAAAALPLAGPVPLTPAAP